MQGRFALNPSVFLLLTLQPFLRTIIGHQELCDYCPSEFQDETDDDDDDSFKRHHHHRHNFNRVRHKPVSGERRHPKDKRPTTKASGDYEIDQSKHLKPTKIHHKLHSQRDNDDKSGVNSDKMLLSTTNPESAYYGEYKFDDNKMTVEDNGNSP